MRLALITGATSGLGEALSFLLAKQGIPLILVARNAAKLQSLQQKLSVKTIPLVCDLASLQERKNLLAAINEYAPDLVINNAGFGLYGPVLDHPLEDFQRMMSVNIEALIEISIVSAKTLKEKNLPGTIVNISSCAAFFPFPYFSIYAASKACIQSFSQAFDEELTNTEIRILTSCPGQIDTPFRHKAASFYPHKKGAFTVTSQQAASQIIKQVFQQKRLAILDWRYSLALFITKWVPNCLLLSYLKRSLRPRIKK